MTSGLTFTTTPECQPEVECTARRWGDEWVAYWGRHKSYAFKYSLSLHDSREGEFRWPVGGRRKGGATGAGATF